MAHLLKVKTFSVKRDGQQADPERGLLSIIEETKDIPFDIKRIFYIYKSKNFTRGGHRHIKNKSALISLAGEYEIFVNDGKSKQTITLKSPDECLILDPQDWHSMTAKDENAILLVLASEFYDVNDYIDEPYADS